jgi:hypothetical protein
MDVEATASHQWLVVDHDPNAALGPRYVGLVQDSPRPVEPDALLGHVVVEGSIGLHGLPRTLRALVPGVVALTICRHVSSLGAL